MDNAGKSPTRRCPFCAEIIRSEAVKCRFCGEFLYGDRQTTLERMEPSPGKVPNLQPNNRCAQYPATGQQGQQGQHEDNGILFFARPSLWALTWVFIKAAAIAVLGGIICFYPLIERLCAALGINLTNTGVQTAGHWRHIMGVFIMLPAVLYMLVRAAKLKNTRYSVSADRIEWARGIFSRKIDNLDMFRIVDVKLHRSLFDCLAGIGTIVLVTKDQSDPNFRFFKVRRPGQLYDIIKKAALEADRRRGVIHIE